MGRLKRDRRIGPAVRYIAACQRPDGAVPWEAGGIVDPWDHVESVMALAVGGLVDEAAAGFRWLASVQRPDGSLPAEMRDGRVTAGHTDANFTAYVATGVWHLYLVTGDVDAVAGMWPLVRGALDCVLGLRGSRGEALWIRDEQGRTWDKGLVAANASVALSLRAGAALAGRLGEDGARWVEAAGLMEEAVRTGRGSFEDRRRYSMDWFYPVLAGVVRGAAGEDRLGHDWDRFVRAGVGCRCVSDRPWYTVAESSELVMALDAVGRRSEASDLLRWLELMALPDGSFVTGHLMPHREPWPDEAPTWTSGAYVLAVDAVTRGTGGSGLFRREWG